MVAGVVLFIGLLKEMRSWGGGKQNWKGTENQELRGGAGGIRSESVNITGILLKISIREIVGIIDSIYMS
jgi:hypothetical protein